MARRAIILLTGELARWPAGLTLAEDDLIVCADGGYANAIRFDLHPHLLLGDMDSIAPELLHTAGERGLEVSKFPAEKDWTDSDLALSYIHEHGCDQAHLVGAWGPRLDHGLANVLLLAKWRELGLSVHLWDERNHLQLLTAGMLILVAKPGDYVSLIPLTPLVAAVTTHGLKYPLTEATLRFGETLGVSNEMLGDQASLSCGEGILLVAQYAR